MNNTLALRLANLLVEQTEANEQAAVAERDGARLQARAARDRALELQKQIAIAVAEARTGK